MQPIIERTTCRACFGDTIKVFELGPQYVSEFPKYLNPTHPKVPLALLRCHACGLVQLSATAPREWLYNEYWYRSGGTESMQKALHDVVEGALRFVEITPRDTVIDIGANDGTLLAQYEAIFPKPYLPPIRVAYEPAKNLWTDCSKHAEVMIQDYFPQPIGSELRPVEGSAKIITSVAMFYDLEDPNTFVAEIKRLLHPNGIWVVQMTDLVSMLETNGFDNIAHEHLEYYSLNSFSNLINKHQLIVLDIEENKVNGGSLRFYVGHRHPDMVIEPAAMRRIHQQSQKEVQMHLHDRNEPYLEFGARVQSARQEFKKFLLSAVLKGGVAIDLMAASTKGSVLQQYYGLDISHVRQAIERDPHKVGRHTVTGIPIVSEEQGRANPANVLVIGAWQHFDQILEREAGKWPGGTLMVCPLPTLRQVTL
jgi:NDP-4-keto-2,6-dideoxyhexose 3-C-methyltransferase